MNLRESYPVIAALFIAAIVICGEVLVVTSSHNDFNSSITVGNDSIEFRIESDDAHTYDVLSMSDTLGAPKGVYVYYDPQYFSMASDGMSSVGGRNLDEKYYIEQLEPTFMVRDINHIDFLNAKELSDLMDKDGKGNAVIILSGALPDTVYDKKEDSKVFSWLETGGRLYWIGNVIGKYVVHEGGYDTIEKGTSLFLGSECIDSEKHQGDSEIKSNGFRDSLYLQNYETTFGVNTSLLPEGTDYLTMGYTDGTYSSTTLVSYGDGVVCVMGGEYSIYQRMDLAQIIASGVGPNTTIVENINGSVQGTSKGTIQKGDSVFITLGGFYPVYCKNHEVV